MRKYVTILTIILLVALSAGCGAAKFEAAAIDENADKCVVCNMQVADNEFATQIVLKDAKVLKFDDLGDLFVWKKRNGVEQIGARFVRDFNSKEWIALENATYVYDKTIRTPMAYGVVSFKEKSDAEKFVRERGTGKMLTSQELISHTWERNKEMMQNMHKEMMQNMHNEADGHGHNGAMKSQDSVNPMNGDKPEGSMK